MIIVEREQVRAAVERALQLNPGRDEVAHQVAAAELCIPVEAVQEALHETEDTET